MFDYDKLHEDSLFAYAKRLEGKTFQDIQNEYDAYLEQQSSGMQVKEEPDSYVPNPKDGSGVVHTLSETGAVKEETASYIPSARSKGRLGNFLERCYFGYEPNSDQEADFAELGIELKVTPIDQSKKGLKAGERLSVTNISYEEPVIEDFEKSHVWNKIHRILLVQYLRTKGQNQFTFPIKYVNLITPPEEDLKIIRDDYRKIIDKIKAGKAHEISEGDTLYLGACTKGSTAAKSLRKQYYGDKIPAKKRNFCLKQSYMNHVLKDFVLKEEVPYDPILKKEEKAKTLEEVVQERISKYVDKTEDEIRKELGLQKDKKIKHDKSMLALRMLGVRSNQAEEFMKAGIVVKAMRIQRDGNVKEQVSLPQMSFKEVAESTWEESELYEYLSSTRFFFVLFKENEKGEYVLHKSLFWTMPVKDLDEEARIVWERMHDILNEGVQLEVDGKRNRILNNFPKANESRAMHVRPHAAKAFYVWPDGRTFGNGNLSDTDELPDGTRITKQCFWLNKDYLLEQFQISD